MKIGEAADVGVKIRGEDHGNGRNEPRSEPATSEEEMDQASSDAPVSIREGMDGLELRVRDRRLDNRRHVVAIHERCQILEQRMDLLRWGRNEVCSERSGQPTADPVLMGSKLAGDPAVSRVPEQEA